MGESEINHVFVLTPNILGYAKRIKIGSVNSILFSSLKTAIFTHNLITQINEKK
jgi:hypothetical protein